MDGSKSTLAALPGYSLAVSYARFSSKAQEEGASLERQTKAARDWCEHEGYELITRSFYDRGLSAYRGKNVAEGGALHAFIAALEDGELPKGITLLVEQADRISRQHQQDGKDLVRKILGAGASIVFLKTGLTLDAFTKLEAMDDIRLTFEFDLAHRESEYKSRRVTQSWREVNTPAVLAGERKRTTKVPSWIRITGAENTNAKGRPDLSKIGFEVIPEKAQVVQEIFSRYAQGEGFDTIARDFNTRRVLPLGGRARVWVGPLVRALVLTKSPFGILEIGQGVGRDRKIVEEVRDYYPRVVDEETQRRVMFRLQEGRQDPAPMIRRKTYGVLIGVLKDDMGNAVKTKRSGNSKSYVTRLNKYLGSIRVLDRILYDEWADVLRALGTADTEEEYQAREALESVQVGLQDLYKRRERMVEEGRKTVTIDARIMAMQADVEELQAGLAAIDFNLSGASHIPIDIEDMPKHEANVFVRRVIRSATVTRRDKGRNARVALSLTLVNGATLVIGDRSAWFDAVSGTP